MRKFTLSLNSKAAALPISDTSQREVDVVPNTRNKNLVGNDTSHVSSNVTGGSSRQKAKTGSLKKSRIPTKMLAVSVSAGNFFIIFLFDYNQRQH